MTETAVASIVCTSGTSLNPRRGTVPRDDGRRQCRYENYLEAWPYAASTVIDASGAINRGGDAARSRLQKTSSKTDTAECQAMADAVLAKESPNQGEEPCLVVTNRVAEVRSPSPRRPHLSEVGLVRIETEALIASTTDAWKTFVSSLPDEQGLEKIALYAARNPSSEAATKWSAMVEGVRQLSDALTADPGSSHASSADEDGVEHVVSTVSCSSNSSPVHSECFAPTWTERQPCLLLVEGCSPLLGPGQTDCLRSRSSDAGGSRISWFSADSDDEKCSDSYELSHESSDHSGPSLSGKALQL